MLEGRRFVSQWSHHDVREETAHSSFERYLWKRFILPRLAKVTFYRTPEIHCHDRKQSSLSQYVSCAHTWQNLEHRRQVSKTRCTFVCRQKRIFGAATATPLRPSYVHYGTNSTSMDEQGKLAYNFTRATLLLISSFNHLITLYYHTSCPSLLLSTDLSPREWWVWCLWISFQERCIRPTSR